MQDFKHPDKFGYIGAFCPAPGVLPYSAEKGIFTEDTFTLPDAYKENTLVMIVKGKNDTTVGNNPILYHKALEKIMFRTFIMKPWAEML